jgi:ligand-binding sensor protein
MEMPAPAHLYRLNELTDLSRVWERLESHLRLSGMACCLLDSEENILPGVGWQDICLHFHRAHPVTCSFCRESDAFIKELLSRSNGVFQEYRCKNGLIDIVMPIVTDGHHLASIFTGQFFYQDDPPNRELFITQSRKLGFDQEKYLQALDPMPLFDRKHVRGIVTFLHNLVLLLVEAGLQNLLFSREVEGRKRAEQAPRENEALLRDLSAWASTSVP